MGAYVCLEPIKHNGHLYGSADRIDLTDEQAGPLLALVAIAPVAPEQAPDDTPAEIDEQAEKPGRKKA